MSDQRRSLCVLNAVIQIRQANGCSDIFSSEGAAELWVWVQAISGIAYTVFSRRPWLLADGKVTATERRDLDAAATLLALGPPVVDAFLYEEAQT